MLGYYKMSIIGTAHQAKKDGVCQDASDVAVLKNGWMGSVPFSQITVQAI